MIVKDILYNNIRRLIKEFTSEGALFEAFFNSLQNNVKEDELISFSEKFSSILTELEESYNDNIVQEDFEKLISSVNEFKATFPEYPNNRFAEIELIVLFLTKIEAETSEEFNLEGDYNTDLFCLHKLPKPIAEKHFFFYDNVDLESSFILFDISNLDADGNLEKLKKFVLDNQVPIELLIHLLSKIGQENIILSQNQYVLIKNELNDKPSLIRSCVCLHILKSGLYIHTPYEYTLKPNISAARKIQIGQNYQQFVDTLTIISEYNHQRDILDKYMRLYHVIENFMFKYPLVGMERSNGGSPFSIRDFQRMYDKISLSEISALKDLIRAVLDVDYIPGTKFSSFLFSKWTSFHLPITLSTAHIDALLLLLKIETKSKKPVRYADVIENEFANFFSQLIYSYRNSLVHNRETEFHLTHDSLLNHAVINNTPKQVLEYFLIPCIEEIVFYLIIEQNPIVWYDKSKLTLWKED
jgi:hypothetical protein